MYRSERHFGLDAGDDFPERSMPGYYIRVPGDRSESVGQELDTAPKRAGHFGLDQDACPERGMDGARSESVGNEFDSRLDSDGRSLLTLFVVAVVLAAAVLGVALFAVFSSEQHASAPSITSRTSEGA